MTEALASFIFNVLLGIIMYFLKQNNDALRERVAKNEIEIDKVRDNTVKKEDFQEFKKELWLRFDKMEVAFERRLQDLHK